MSPPTSDRALSDEAPFRKVAIIGLGLQGGSIGLALAAALPAIATTGYDLSAANRQRAAERGLVGQVCATAPEAVTGADLVIFCVPPGAMGAAAAEVAGALAPDAIVSDVGSSKVLIGAALAEALPAAAAAGRVIPAHPVAGTENSGPDAGFATLEQVCAEQGADWEENLDQRAREYHRMRELGLPQPEWMGADRAANAVAAAPEAE